MKISRIAQLGAVAAIAALALSACASNEGRRRRRSASASDGTRPHRHARRLRPIRAGGRRPGVDRRIPDRQPRRHRQLRPRRLRRRPRVVPVRRRAVRRLRPRVQGRGDRSRTVRRAASRARTSSSSPPTSRRSRSSFNIEGVDSLNLDAATIAGIFAGTITNWNDPAIAATERRRHAARPRDHAGAPLRRVGHDRELHRLPRADRPSRSGPTGSVEEWPLQGGEAAQGTSGVVDAVKGGQGTIGYADALADRRRLGSVSVQVGDEWSSRPPRAPRSPRRVAARRGPRRDRPRRRARPHHDRGRRIPDHARELHDRCVEYADADARSPREGLLRATAISAEGQEAAAAAAGSAPISASLREQSQAASTLIK